MGSPLRSPLRGSAENPIRPSSQDTKEEEPTSSPLPSPLRRPEFPLPLPAPPEKSHFDGMEEEAMDSPLRNTIPPAPQNTPEMSRSPAPAAIALAIANQLTRDDLAVVAKMVVGGGDGAGGRAVDGGYGSNATRDAETVFRPVPPTVRRATVRRAALGLRVSAMLLCLVSFSVMAADKTEGWAGDFFDRYEEYRYCLAVNIIAFVYSAFQVIKEVHHSITKKYIVRRPKGYVFDFSMDQTTSGILLDLVLGLHAFSRAQTAGLQRNLILQCPYQILAYLLISASSAAASRCDIWVSRFGGDDFTHMINASVAMAFLAFIAIAVSSLISAYNLFSWNI